MSREYWHPLEILRSRKEHEINEYADLAKGR